jgi:hypothetical protein
MGVCAFRSIVTTGDIRNFHQGPPWLYPKYVRFSKSDITNVWNHKQFQGGGINGGASTTLGSSNFVNVASGYDPRTIQLALRVYF